MILCTWSLTFLNATYLSALVPCVSQRYTDPRQGQRDREDEAFTTHTTSNLVLTEQHLRTSVDAFLMVMCLWETGDRWHRHAVNLHPPSSHIYQQSGWGWTSRWERKRGSTAGRQGGGGQGMGVGGEGWQGESVGQGQRDENEKGKEDQRGDVGQVLLSQQCGQFLSPAYIQTAVEPAML